MVKEVRQYDISDDTVKLLTKETFKYWDEKQINKIFQRIEEGHPDANILKWGLLDYIAKLHYLLS